MRRLWHISLVALLAGCGEATVDPVLAGTFPGLYVGNKSMGPHADTVLATMRQPLVVIILDEEGIPVPGVIVRWEAFDGASVSDRSMPTDAGGESAISLILGAVSGTYRARAHVNGVAGSPVDFVAMAHAGSPVAIAKARGDGLEVAPGTSVVHTVRVTDRYGNGVPGVFIEWAAADGGSTAWRSNFTNRWGIAEMTFRTAERTGWQRVTARASRIPGSPAVTFMTEVTARPIQ